MPRPRKLDLFGRELLAVDGTRLKAVNSRDRNFTKAKLDKALAKSDERLTRYLELLDEADHADDDGPGSASVDQLQEKIDAIKGRRERLEGYRDELKKSGEDQLSLTDPDARAMHAKTRIGIGYNIQIAVDVKHKLIVEQQVHNKVSDLDRPAKIEKPEAYVIYRNSVCPLNPYISIEYRLPKKGNVNLEILDGNGRVIAVPAKGEFESGIHMAAWNTSDSEAGTYSFRLRYDDTEIKNSLILI